MPADMKAFSVLLAALAMPLAAFCSVSALDAGLAGDGVTDDTAALQKLLDGNGAAVDFPKATYLLGHVDVRSGAVLRFEPGATVVPARDGLVETQTRRVGGKDRSVEVKLPLFGVHGNDVRIEGLHFDFSSGATEKDVSPVETVVSAAFSTNLTVSGFALQASSPAKLPHRHMRIAVRAENCANVTVENCTASGLTHLVWAECTGNLVVRGNRQTGGASMTTFQDGGECLRHHDNWSRSVEYQCVWRGGSPDPSRKAPNVPLGTADTVHRGSRKDDPDYVPHTMGVYDVFVQNNYAEYGTVLCWGNKSRQTVIDGNIARFMWDYSYGVEGGENVVFSNNISVNSAVAGFMSLYWGEKLLVTGNICLVRHEEFDRELAGRDEGVYFGQFVRLHHGPQNPEDRYGAGTVEISGNLFVNELADRPSGISVEGGRDVHVSGNKIVNGLLRKSDELVFVKAGEKDTADEFVSGGDVVGADCVAERRTGANLSRLTVTGNEFILRQPGEKPQVIVNGTASRAIVKDNVFRKEDPTARVAPEALAAEQTPARFQMYATDDRAQRDLRNAGPAAAIVVAPRTPCTAVVTGNVTDGWTAPVSTEGASDTLKAFVDGNLELSFVK